MFQPFEKFKPEYIPRLLNLNKRYLVSQTYTNSFNHFEEVHKTDILLSDYDEIGQAELHKKAVRNDKYASIIDLKNEKHIETLNKMLGSDSQYTVYWAIVKSATEVKKRLDMKYKDNIRRYLANNTNWRIGAGETVSTSLEVVFGQLHLTIKRGSQTIRVKFDDIETS